MTATSMTGSHDPQRGEIWLVNFDPTIGAEIKKLRPAIVVNTPAVGRLPLRIVVPITDWKPHYAEFSWFVQLDPNAENGLSKESGADSFQVKSISVERFIQRLGSVPEEYVAEIAAGIALCIGYNP